MIARIICAVKGHKRGVRLTATPIEVPPTHAMYQCPRCRATWTRKKSNGR